MKSYFTEYANSILYIPVYNSDLITDPSTGNKTPNSTILEVLAILNEDYVKFAREERPKDRFGQDTNEIYLKGYLVDPMFFPDGITFPLACKAKINEIEGILRIPLLIPSSYNVAEIIGTKIVGYFQKGN